MEKDEGVEQGDYIYRSRPSFNGQRVSSMMASGCGGCGEVRGMVSESLNSQVV